MSKKQKKLPKIGKRTVKNDAEYQVYKALKNILPRGADLEYEVESIPYIIESDYLPDFKITKRDGTVIFVEYKGNGRSFDHSVRRKMIAVKTQHPEIDLRIIFHTDGKIGPIRKDGTFRRQSDWAKENNFKFAIRTPPKGWFNE